MGQITFEHAVNEKLQGKPYLQPVFSGGNYDITRRLREYDPALFVVWNGKRRKYEVHSLSHIGNTYACDAPNNRLDARIEEEIRRGDIRVRGDAIFREVDDHNDYLERSIQNSRNDEIRAAAVDLKSSFAQLGWEGI